MTIVDKCRWVIDLEGAPATLYEGESFKLGFKFSDRYPFDSPQVENSSDDKRGLTGLLKQHTIADRVYHNIKF